jgi:hypothetical protein
VRSLKRIRLGASAILGPLSPNCPPGRSARSPASEPSRVRMHATFVASREVVSTPVQIAFRAFGHFAWLCDLRIVWNGSAPSVWSALRLRPPPVTMRVKSGASFQTTEALRSDRPPAGMSESPPMSPPNPKAAFGRNQNLCARCEEVATEESTRCNRVQALRAQIAELREIRARLNGHSGDSPPPASANPPPARRRTGQCRSLRPSRLLQEGVAAVGPVAGDPLR